MADEPLDTKPSSRQRASNSQRGYNPPQPNQPLRGDDTARFQRLSQIQKGMRSYLNNFRAPSSLYSQPPNTHLSMFNGPATTPKPSFRRFFGQWGESSADPSNSSSREHLPLHVQDEPVTYSPARQPSEWLSEPTRLDGPTDQPMPSQPPAAAVSTNPRGLEIPTVNSESTADVSTSSRSRSRSGSGPRSGSSESRQHRRHKRRRQHRHHNHDEVWVRRHRPGTRPRRRHALHEPSHSKYLGSVVSGLFLVAVLATYLSIAITIKNLGQELHILFILTITGTGIFFVHSLIKLYFLRDPKKAASRRHQRIPSIQGPGGFKPEVPIRVHLVRDEEIEAQDEAGEVVQEKLPNLKAPPPAYGLWRYSVKVDPALLHWKKVDAPAAGQISGQTSGQSSSSSSQENLPATSRPNAPRPPSYVSDDGVGYVVEAQPRSTVYIGRPPTEMHPAFRLHQQPQAPQPGTAV